MKKVVTLVVCIVGILVISSPSFSQSKSSSVQIFTNPILPSGPDPWAIYHNGYYYYMNTLGNRLAIWKTRDLAFLKSTQKNVIWRAPKHGNYSHDIWAPELHYLNGKWYIYFAADNGHNKTHRIYVLENDSTDPLKGNWTFRGKVAAPSDKWAIDASVFKYHHRLYMIWSGWKGNQNGQQNIYLAKMKNPYTIEGKRVKLSSPTYSWEKHGKLNTPNGTMHINVNEGPEILHHDDDLFLIYSASGCWTDYYALGMLKLVNKDNLMKNSSWKKYPKPVFKSSSQNGVYAPGHNSFFMSPDSSQYWILYHANSKPHEGCGGSRSPRMQQFHWNEDGTPNFGVPMKTGIPLVVPSR